MIYAKHDFTHNFLYATGYNDKAMLDNIIIDEFTRLIVENKQDVVSLLRKNNVLATINMSPEEVRILAVNEISKGNQSFSNEIGKMIAANQFSEKTAKDIISGQYHNATADPTVPSATPVPDAEKKQVLKNVSAKVWDFLKKASQDEKVQEEAGKLISQGLTKVFDKNNPQAPANNQTSQERIVVNEIRNEKKKLSTGGKVAIIAGSIIVLGLVVFLIVKAGKSGSAQPVVAPAPQPSV